MAVRTQLKQKPPTFCRLYGNISFWKADCGKQQVKMVVHSRNHFVLAKGCIMSKGKVRASPRNQIKQALKA
jgi:hypothetical protein